MRKLGTLWGVSWVLLSEGVKRFCEVRIWKCSRRICL